MPEAAECPECDRLRIQQLEAEVEAGHRIYDHLISVKRRAVAERNELRLRCAALEDALRSQPGGEELLDKILEELEE
jgi:hypothetical protein